MPIKSLKLNSFPKLLGLIVLGFIILIVFYFFAKWCFAYEIAVHSQNREVSEYAVELSPNEPQNHYALSVWQEQTFLPEDLKKSLVEIETATALSPNDYRLWLALGKIRSLNGDSAGAENALKKAQSLAPNYSEVLWAMGNFYFRQGKITEAFPLIRRTAEIDSNYRIPAISILWQMFDGNVSQIKNALGESPQIKAALTDFLMKQGRSDQAVEVWNTISESEKNTEFQQIGSDLFTILIAEKKFRTALKIKNRMEETEKFYNGGFEEPIQQSTNNVFDWQISGGLKPVIGQNNESKHSGNTSLFIIFKSDDGKDFRQIQQTVPIISGKNYKFEFFYKTELKTSATFRWEIVDTAESKILAVTKPIEANSDWTSLSADFTVPENSEAVIIRLAREDCKQGLCPISGKVWFDDFTIR